MKRFKFSWESLADLSATPIQKSFYGKATIYTRKDGTKFLMSYSTIVALVTRKGEIYRTWGGYSRTTAKHMNAFLGENLRKAELMSLPLAKLY